MKNFKLISLTLVLAMILSVCLIACTPKSNETSSVKPNDTKVTDTGACEGSEIPPKTTAASTSSAIPTTPAPTTKAEEDEGIDENAIKIYSAALDALKSKEDLKYQLDLTMSIIMEGGSLDTVAKKIVTVNGMGKDDMKLRVLSETSFFGMEMSDDEYYENGYVYVTSGEESYKSALEPDMPMYNFEDDASMFLAVPELEGNYGSSKVTEDENGNKTVVIKLNAENILSIMGEEAEGLNVADLDDSTCMIFTVVVNQSGLPTSAKCELRLTATQDGQTAGTSMTMDVSLEYDNVTAQAPEGYQDYEEMTAEDDFDFDFDDIEDM